MNKEDNRLRQVAGVDVDGKIRQRAMQFLSMFGINVGVQSQEVDSLINYIKDMPGYSGQQHPDQYQSDWTSNPKTFNQTRYIQSKDGYQYTY